MPYNSTHDDPATNYADVVPPYPFGFDFERDDTPVPPYESLGYDGPEAGALWPAFYGQELGHQPMQQDGCPCPAGTAGVIAVTFQLGVLLVWLYADLGKYNPVAMR